MMRVRLVTRLAAVLGLAAVGGLSFGQQDAGERFTAPKSVNVSLNGGNLIINASTAFSGNSLPGTLAPFAPQVVPGTCYSIGPGTLAVTYTATVTYSTSALPAGTSASTLRLYQVLGHEWTPVSGSTVNTSTFQVTGKLTTTGTFAILTGTPPTYSNEIYYQTLLAGDKTLRTTSSTYGARQVADFSFGNLGTMVMSPQRNFLLQLHANPAGSFDVYMTSIDGSNPTLVVGGIANIGPGGCFSSDGSSFYSAVQKPGSTAWNVVKVALATGAMTVVHTGGSSWGPRGGESGVIAFADGTTITAINSTTGAITTFTSPSADGAVNSGLDVSMDGTKIIWATSDGAIYDATITGGTIKELLKPSSGFRGSDVLWSPDGTMFAYMWNNGASSASYLVSLSNLGSPSSLLNPVITGPNLIIWR